MQFIVKHIVVTSYHSQWYSFITTQMRAENDIGRQWTHQRAEKVIKFNMHPFIVELCSQHWHLEWVCCPSKYAKPIASSFLWLFLFGPRWGQAINHWRQGMVWATAHGLHKLKNTSVVGGALSLAYLCSRRVASERLLQCLYSWTTSLEQLPQLGEDVWSLKVSAEWMKKQPFLQ